MSGLSVRHADAIYAVQFQCSDGTKSEVIGGTGGVGPDPYTIGEEGIRQLSIRTSERIDALTINRRYLGGYDGTEQPVVNPCENSNGVVVGAYMSWRDSLKSIAFNWVC